MGISGHNIENNDMYMYNLFNKETVAKLAENAWNKMWVNFMSFGTASAGLIGLVLMCRLIKLLIDTIIHGYALYSLYGFSIHLIGAIWNSVTQLLLHLGQQQKEKLKEDEEINNETNKEEKTVNQAREEEGKLKKLYPEIITSDNTKHNSL